MARRRSAPQALGSTGQALIRIVVSSYFIAGAIGLIEGVSLAPLFIHALPASAHGIAGVLGMAVMLILSGLILTGHWLRPAALLLAMALFWSSYLQMIALGVEGALGQFWRDLALVAALLLTYGEPQDRRRRTATLFRRKIEPRRLGDRVSPTRVSIERDRSHDPVRMPRRAPVAVPVPGPEPVFFTRRQKPTVLHPELKVAAPAPAEIDNVFAIPSRSERAS